MFKIIKEQNQNVIFEASGKIAANDYEVLTPTVKKIIDKYGHANLMIIAEDLKGETFNAMSKDMKFGFGPYLKVKRFALVSDQEWLRAAVHVMSPFTKTEEKVFNLDQKDEAEAWLESQ
ncbi:STAS/SEC14 domain-containing protein [Candidatus Saccharibacteria bacterium]|nr:STAS/SEC14 domain-containing protein [Candidatus Saccharibacteria bacterium]